MCTTSSSSVLAATTGWKRCKASFRATTLACTCQTLNDTPSSQTRGTMHSITKHVACVVLEAVNITTKESCVHDKRCESQCELCEDSSLLNFLSLAKVFLTKPPQVSLVWLSWPSSHALSGTPERTASSMCICKGVFVRKAEIQKYEACSQPAHLPSLLSDIASAAFLPFLLQSSTSGPETHVQDSHCQLWCWYHH